MREIKFRAWHKELKIMANVVVIALRKFVCVSHPDIKLTDSSWDWEDIELMQFTGLHDKNGKEIYESDILKIMYRSIPTDIFIELVNFRDCEFQVGNLSLYNFYKIGDSIEIIGNIFESPELKIYNFFNKDL